MGVVVKAHKKDWRDVSSQCYLFGH